MSWLVGKDRLRISTGYCESIHVSKLTERKRAGREERGRGAERLHQRPSRQKRVVAAHAAQTEMGAIGTCRRMLFPLRSDDVQERNPTAVFSGRGAFFCETLLPALIKDKKRSEVKARASWEHTRGTARLPPMLRIDRVGGADKLNRIGCRKIVIALEDAVITKKNIMNSVLQEWCS
jgi:hypothetical protein